MSTVKYVTCPQCGDPFTEPLLPASASYHLVRTHTRGARRNRCRAVLTVHPDGRTEAEVVPAELSLEDALYEYQEEAFYQYVVGDRKAGGWDALAVRA